MRPELAQYQRKIKRQANDKRRVPAKHTRSLSLPPRHCASDIIRLSPRLRCGSESARIKRTDKDNFARFMTHTDNTRGFVGQVVDTVEAEQLEPMVAHLVSDLKRNEMCETRRDCFRITRHDQSAPALIGVVCRASGRS